MHDSLTRNRLCRNSFDRRTAWFESLEDRRLLAADVIVDSEDFAHVQTAGQWSPSIGVEGFHGENYLHDGRTGQGQKSLTWRPELPSGGRYEVMMSWTAAQNRASNAAVSINHQNGVQRTTVNQQIHNGVWVSLGEFDFPAGMSDAVTIANTGANGFVVADAVRFVQQSTPSGPGPVDPQPANELVLDSEDIAGISIAGNWRSSAGTPGFVGGGYLHDGNAQRGHSSVTYTPAFPEGGLYEVFARWASYANRSSRTKIAVHHDGGVAERFVDQRQNGGEWVSLGDFGFTPGAGERVILSNEGADGYVIADAVRFVRKGASTPVAGPEVQVLLGTQPVADGGTVNFGTTSIGRPVARTFTVFNAGEQTLNLTPLNPGNLPVGFTLVSNLGSTNVAPGGSTQFTIRLDAVGTGNFSGPISFGNNDSDENPFDAFLQGTANSAPVISELIVDSEDAGQVEIIGDWRASSGSPGFHGDNYLHDGNSGKGQKSVHWRPNFPVSGTYEVFLRWTSHANRASNASVLVDHRDGNDEVRVNQRSGGGQWNSLGQYFFEAGGARGVMISNFAGANGFVIADAVRFVLLDGEPPAGGPEVDVLEGGNPLPQRGTLNFGTTAVGSPVNKVVTVRNTGTNELSLTPLNPGNLPVGFALVSNLGSTSIAPGASTSFAVRLAATGTGNFAGNISFGTNDSDENPFVLALQGSVVGASVLNEIVLDTESQIGVTLTGSWTASDGAPGFNGSNYLHDGNFGKGQKAVTFAPHIAAAGIYDVFSRWTSSSNRSSSVPVTVLHADGSTDVRVNQQLDGGQWNSLGQFLFDAGSSGRITVANGFIPGYVIADAVRLVRVGDPPAPAPEIDVLFDQRSVADGGAIEFGSTAPGIPVDQLITVRNTGTQTLTLSPLDGGSFPPGFSLINNITTTQLVPGGSTSFGVRMMAAMEGTLRGGITLSNNDGDENPYDLTLNGSVATPPSVTIIDDGATGYNESGFGWFDGGVEGANEGDYRYHRQGDGSNKASWSFDVTPGVYRVSASWAAHANRASNATYQLFDDNILVQTSSVSQKEQANDLFDQDTAWRDLDLVPISGRTLKVELSDQGDGIVIADAIRLQRVHQRDSALTADSASIDPGRVLTLTSSSTLDPAAVTMVTFLSPAGTSVRVPPLEVTGTTVKVAVPPVADSTSGSGNYSVSVLQASGEQITEFHGVVGLTVNPLVTAQGNPGDITLAVLDATRVLLQSAADDWQEIENASAGAVPTADFRAALQNDVARLDSLKAELQGLINGQVNQIVLGDVEGESVFVNLESLSQMDRLVVSYLLPAAADAPAPAGASTTLSRDRLFQTAAEGEQGVNCSEQLDCIRDRFNPSFGNSSAQILEFFGDVNTLLGNLVGLAAGRGVAIPSYVGPGIYLATVLAPAAISAALKAAAFEFIQIELNQPPRPVRAEDFEAEVRFVKNETAKFLAAMLGSTVVQRRADKLYKDPKLANRLKEMSDPIISQHFPNICPAEPGAAIDEALRNSNTIFEEISKPSLSIDDSFVTEGNGPGTSSVIFFVTLDKTVPHDVSFRYSTTVVAGGATSGQDFVAVSQQTKTIPAGSIGTTVTIGAVGDLEYEQPDERFQVELSAPDGARVKDGIGIGTIVDDDLPNLTIADALQTELDQGQENDLIFLLNWPSPLTDPITVQYEVVPGPSPTATPGVDYRVPTTNTLILPAGTEPGASIHVAVLGDNLAESNEQVTVRLLNATNVTITDGEAIGVIQNDDTEPAPPFVQIHSASCSSLGGFNYRWTVTGRAGARFGSQGMLQFFSDLGSAPGNFAASADNWTATGSTVIRQQFGQPTTTSFTFTVDYGFAYDGRGSVRLGAINTPFVSDGRNIDCPGLQANSEGPHENGSVVAVTPAELQLAADTARALWVGAGITLDQRTLVENVQLQVSDLPGSLIGFASEATILVDTWAAGHGWYTGLPGGVDDLAGRIPAADRIDLLTTVAHEMGHLLGYHDLHDQDNDLMSAILSPGERRLPWPAAVDHLFADEG